MRRRRISAQTSSPPRAATTVKCSPGNSGIARQLVLHGAELVERVLQLDRQQLGDDAVDRFERQAATRKIHLAGRRDDVRLVAGVHDQRFAVDADNRLKQ